MKPCILFLFWCLGGSLLAQQIKTITDIPPYTTYAFAKENHYNREGDLLKQVYVYDGKRSDSIQYRYVKNEEGQILQKWKHKGDRILGIERYAYEGPLLVKRTSFEGNPIALQGERPDLEHPGVHVQATIFSYYPDDSLKSELEWVPASQNWNNEVFAEFPANETATYPQKAGGKIDTLRYTYYKYRQDTMWIRVQMGLEIESTTLVRTPQKLYREKVSKLRSSEELMEHEIEETFLDENQQPIKVISWNKGPMGSRGITSEATTRNGKPGYQFIIHYDTELDAKGNWIKREALVQGKTMVAKREIEYFE